MPAIIECETSLPGLSPRLLLARLLLPRLLALAAGAGFLPLPSLAAEPATPPVEEVYVTGGREALRELPGSASLVDEAAIQTFDTTDVTDLLAQVPGVYVRYEDGYGLRPNIGIRGVTSDRSQKLTLMEDGILITPSPYAAPAAYYLPNVNRMAALEVFKGPAAIAYGPHTVGGALNWVTRGLPEADTLELDATAGDSGYYKYRLFAGDSYRVNEANRHGFWIDALTYGADGFKTLPSGADTGFVRRDLNAKWGWHHAGEWDHQVIVKWGYADEVSDETYLGLTDSDFAADSLSRYAASALDRFDSIHRQWHLLYTVKPSARLSVDVKLYQNQFSRTWKKLEGFWASTCGGLDCTPDIQTVLGYPTGWARHLAILRGEADSRDLGEYLDITANARDFTASGLSLDGRYGEDSAAHRTRFGLRYHRDEVARLHRPEAYAMTQGHLVYDGVTRELKTDNAAEASALAAFVQHEWERDRLTLTAGLRTENIRGDYQNTLTQDAQSRRDSLWIPGAGYFYRLSDSLGILGGVNRGFSPAVADSEADAETSVNYEQGLRFEQGDARASAIGFFSDYRNLLGRCRVSDAGCEADTEFNGGEAAIWGLELDTGYRMRLGRGLALPVSWVYTYTQATFESDFESGFSQWGQVKQGDYLPYTPVHQARLQLSLESARWYASLEGRYVGKMREVPDQGDYKPGYYTEDYSVWDLAYHFVPSDNWDYFVTVENLLNEQVIVSRRPFGARPNPPRAWRLGLSWRY